MDVLLLLARVILAGVFGLAGVTKLMDLPGSRAAMRNFGVPERYAGPAGLALPIVELVVAVLLLPTATAWWAALAGLGLLLAFIGGIAYNLSKGRTPDCHCFGQVHSEPVGTPTLVRNGIFAALAAFVLVQGPSAPGASLVGWWGEISGVERFLLALSLLLLAGLAGLGWLMIQLMQQNGRLLLRVEALESGAVRDAAPSAPATPEAGLAIGTPAPDFALPSTDGDNVSLQQLRAGGQRILLLFTDAHCGPCNALMPEIRQWQEEHGEQLTIVPISRGSAEEIRAKQQEHGLRHVLVQHDREVSEAYQSLPTPSAVLVRPDGTIGSRAALGAQAIRSLVTQATTRTAPFAPERPNGAHAAPAARPSMVGQDAPAVTLPDLDGREVSLEQLRGQRTLVVFWNPGCGFCRRMVDELKAWEASPPEGAPKMVLVSTGTVEANREMGLRSPIVLDQGFATGRAFGASGTPSAVLVDADGKIASEVAVGAPGVMELAQGSSERTGQVN